MKELFFGLIFVLLFTVFGYGQSEMLSLNDCIEMALKNNPMIVRTMNQDEASDEDVLASYSGILPTINVSANSGRVEAGGRETEGDVPVGIDSTGNASMNGGQLRSQAM